MRAIRLIWTFARLDVINELQYRINFVLGLFQTLVGLAAALAGLGIIYAHTQRLDGWTSDELLVLLGVYFLVSGAINALIQPSMQRFMEDVRLGTLDFVLTKPVDAQLLVSVRQLYIWRGGDFITGIIVLIIATGRLTGSIGLGEALAFIVSLLAGAVTVYSFWLFLATLSFWVIKIDNILVIFQSMYQAGRWPVTIYPNALRWALTILVPIAFAVTVPAQGLTGRLDGRTLLLSIGLAAVSVVFSRWFWQVGIRRYSGASA